MTTAANGILGKSDVFKVDPTTIAVKDGWNPRTDFSSVPDLAKSIAENGVLQPLILRRLSDGELELIDGECRLQATLIAIKDGAEIKSIPAFIRGKGFTQADALVHALIANQGTPLKPLEQAEAFRRFVAWGWSQSDIAKRIGKSQAHVSHTMALLDAAPELKTAIQNGEVKATEAAVIIREAKKDGNPEEYQKEQVVIKATQPKAPKQSKAVVNRSFKEQLEDEILDTFGSTNGFYDYRKSMCDNGVPITINEQLAYGMGRLSILCEQHNATVHDIEKLLKTLVS